MYEYGDAVDVLGRTGLPFGHALLSQGGEAGEEAEGCHYDGRKEEGIRAFDVEFDGVGHQHG